MTAQILAPPTQKPILVALGGLCAMAVAMGIGRFVYTPILPIMAEELGLSGSETGLIASANFLGYLVGALAASARFVSGSRRTWLIAGLAGNAIGLAAMGLTDSLSYFVLVRFLGGVASAFVLVFASTLVLERAAISGRSLVSSLHFAGVGTGVAISSLIVVAVAEFGGWAAQWQVSGAVAVIGAVLVAILIPKDTSSQPFARAVPGHGASNGLARLIAAYGLFGFGYVITATFLVALVRGEPAIAPAEPIIWLVFGIGTMPSAALWTWVGKRLGMCQAFALACAIEAFAVTASVLWVSMTGVILGTALLGLTFVGITAVGLVAARGMVSGDARQIFGLMTASFGLGQIVGPSFAGFVYDSTGSFVLPSLIAAGALALAAALTATLRS
jgi:predicted MFS family arabinose efflux permease